MIRNVGEESSKTYQQKLQSGFFSRYMYGDGLEVGYKGYLNNIVPILPEALGIDLDYPGYDGIHLPFADNTQNYVYSSHCLEHIMDRDSTLKEWMRVIKYDGYLIVVVPHQYLYEKKQSLPSQWNGDHKVFYTPSVLLNEIEQALPPNSYRVRMLEDVDNGYDYSITPELHAGGCYEITCVLQKIKKPNWGI